VGFRRFAELQDRLYAQDKWAVLAIFQAMDVAGKDGAIKACHVGCQPAGMPSLFLQVSFCRRPRSRLSLALHQVPAQSWAHRHLQPELLRGDASSPGASRVSGEQKIPSSLITKDIRKKRFRDIRSFEPYLARNGVVVVKFFLHLSKKEQQRRFLERAETPEKNWKFSASDMAERKYRDEYQRAYEDMIQNTATKDSPWYVVPANNKWFTRLVVVAALIDTLASLDVAYPQVDQERPKEIATAKRMRLKSK